MFNGFFNIPEPKNEPVLGFAPGSPERAEIKAEGRMIGDIKAPRILIADGAGFKGHIDMDVD